MIDLDNSPVVTVEFSDLVSQERTSKTSNNLKKKDRKRWRQFARDYRVKGVEFYRDMFNIKDQAQSRIWPPRGGKARVFTATLHSLSEALKGTAPKDYSGSDEWGAEP